MRLQQTISPMPKKAIPPSLLEINFPWPSLCKGCLVKAYENKAYENKDWRDFQFLASARAGDPWGLRFAYKAGADVMARDFFGNTAGILVGTNGHAPMIGFLRYMGLNFFAVNDFNNSAADLACARGRKKTLAALQGFPLSPRPS